MKVSIKHFEVDVELGNNGITFDVRDSSGAFLGDLRIGKGTVEWCKGKTQKGNGKRVSWEALIAWFESQP
jgi:hypothetical protein